MPETPEPDSYSNDSPIARLANTLLRTALESGAREISLIPTSDGRMDFVTSLQTISLPGHLRAGLIARFKNQAQLDLLVTSQNQTGRFPLFYYERGQKVQVEVTTEPSPYGEGIRARLISE